MVLSLNIYCLNRDHHSFIGDAADAKESSKYNNNNRLVICEPYMRCSRTKYFWNGVSACNMGYVLRIAEALLS